MLIHTKTKDEIDFAFEELHNNQTGYKSLPST